jgi:hypothetical protein
VIWHSGLPFSVLSTPYSADGKGIVQGGGPQYASVVPGVPLYDHNAIPGVTQPGTYNGSIRMPSYPPLIPARGPAYGGDSPQNCQFGTSGRNALRGPDFFWSDFYLTKWFPLSERVKLRVEAQFFNVFNHPNFALPSDVYAGIPGKPSTQVGFGALTYHVTADGTAGSRVGRRQQPAHDRASRAPGVLIRQS